MVRSRREVPGSGSRSFATLVIPGIGSGNNEYSLDDERHVTDTQGGNVDRLQRDGLISVTYQEERVNSWLS